MMSQDQVKNVTYVYSLFVDSEVKRGWTELDDLLDYLAYLDDDQLTRECDVIYEIHKKGKVKCLSDHEESKCLVPKIVEAAGAILELYQETGQLHKNNRYILEHYLAYEQAQWIVAY